MIEVVGLKLILIKRSWPKVNPTLNSHIKVNHDRNSWLWLSLDLKSQLKVNTTRNDRYKIMSDRSKGLKLILCNVKRRWLKLILK
jgi:hypothetical protein